MQQLGHTLIIPCAGRKLLIQTQKAQNGALKEESWIETTRRCPFLLLLLFFSFIDFFTSRLFSFLISHDGFTRRCTHGWFLFFWLLAWMNEEAQNGAQGRRRVEAMRRDDAFLLLFLFFSFLTLSFLVCFCFLVWWWIPEEMHTWLIFIVDFSLTFHLFDLVDLLLWLCIHLLIFVVYAFW